MARYKANCKCIICDLSVTYEGRYNDFVDSLGDYYKIFGECPKCKKNTFHEVMNVYEDLDNG